MKYFLIFAAVLCFVFSSENKSLADQYGAPSSTEIYDTVLKAERSSRFIGSTIGTTVGASLLLGGALSVGAGALIGVSGVFATSGSFLSSYSYVAGGMMIFGGVARLIFPSTTEKIIDRYEIKHKTKLTTDISFEPFLLNAFPGSSPAAGWVASFSL